MLPEHSFLLVLIGLAILFLTGEMVRRRILLSNYSLIWLLLGFTFIIWGMIPKLLLSLASFMKMHHITIVLGILFVFIFLEALHTSSVLTLHSCRQRDIIQKLALMQWQIDRLIREAGRERSSREARFGSSD